MSLSSVRKRENLRKLKDREIELLDELMKDPLFNLVQLAKNINITEGYARTKLTTLFKLLEAYSVPEDKRREWVYKEYREEYRRLNPDKSSSKPSFKKILPTTPFVDPDIVEDINDVEVEGVLPRFYYQLRWENIPKAAKLDALEISWLSELVRQENLDDLENSWRKEYKDIGDVEKVDIDVENELIRQEKLDELEAHWRDESEEEEIEEAVKEEKIIETVVIPTVIEKPEMAIPKTIEEPEKSEGSEEPIVIYDIPKDETPISKQVEDILSGEKKEKFFPEPVIYISPPRRPESKEPVINVSPESPRINGILIFVVSVVVFLLLIILFTH